MMEMEGGFHYLYRDKRIRYASGGLQVAYPVRLLQLASRFTADGAPGCRIRGSGRGKPIGDTDAIRPVGSNGGVWQSNRTVKWFFPTRNELVRVPDGRSGK
jgi:hypothetical protein